MITETGNPIIDDADTAVSWKAIFAGATGSIAVTLILVAFGIGVGFSVISPWSDQGVSATTFTVAAASICSASRCCPTRSAVISLAGCVRAGIA